MSFDKLFDGSNAHLLPSTAAECAAFLRRYNEWRRGDPEDNSESEMPSPTEIGLAIDMAIELICQRDELLAAAEAIEIDADECLDFDECTAMMVPLDTYHKLTKAVARATGGADE